jgi:hypothetical protein
MATNYPPGVSGNEPEITGLWAPICVQCGNKFEAVGDEDYCVNCKVSTLINNYYKGG